MSQEFFTGVKEPIRFGGLDSSDPLSFKVYEPDRIVLGKRMEDHLRIAVCFWHSFAWDGRGHVRRRHPRPAVARRRRGPDGRRPGEAGGRLRVLRQARRPVLLLPRPRRRPGGRDASPSPATTSTRSSTRPQATRSGPGVRLLWGTANLFSHPRYAGRRRRPTPTRRSSPTPRRRSSTCSRSPSASAARTTSCGAAARATRPSSTPTSRREERPVRPLPAPRRRAQAQDRLRGHAPHRAEAAGADEAPVRLRLGDRPRLPRPPRPRGRVPRQHRGEPRHARRPQLPPRGRLRRRERDLRQHRREPRRLPERLGHRPVPELGRRARAGRSTRSSGAAASRPAASTSTPSCAARASTGPTCSTPTSAGSTRWPARCSSPPTWSRRGRSTGIRSRSATPAGAASSAGRSSTAPSASPTLAAKVASPARSTRARSRAARSCSRTSSTSDIWAVDRATARVGGAVRRPADRRGGHDGPRPRHRRLDDGDEGGPRRRGRAPSAASAPSEYDFDVPRPLWSEQDPRLWWDGTIAAIRAVLAATGVAARRRRRGRPDRPDARRRPPRRRGRGPPAGDPVERPADRRRVRRDPRGRRPGAARSRSPATTRSPGFTAPKLVWVRDHEPDVWSRVAHVLLPKDYVRLRLTGDHAMDKADGAGTILFDLAARDWSPEVVGGARDRPGLAAADVRGAGRHRRRSPPGRPPRPGCGPARRSSPAAATRRRTPSASARSTPGVVALSLGTSGVVFATTDRPLFEPRGRVHAFCHAVPGPLAHDVGDAVGRRQPALVPRRAGAGRVVRRRSSLPAGGGARRAATGCSSCRTSPGERTPTPRPPRPRRLRRPDPRPRPPAPRRGPSSRAWPSGCGTGSTSWSRRGCRPRPVSGPPAAARRAPLWRQILADVLGAEIATVDTAEGAAYGAALLAAVGAGWFPTVEAAAAALVTATAIAAPGPDSAAYAAGPRRLPGSLPGARPDVPGALRVARRRPVEGRRQGRAVPAAGRRTQAPAAGRRAPIRGAWRAPSR